MLRIAEMAETSLPVFILRVLSPAIVSVAALSLLPLKQAAQPPDHSAITTVVAATTVPRRAAILALLSLAAITYLGDGLVFVIFSVISKDWPRHTAIPLNAVLGLASFSGIAVIGAWKDVSGADVWSLKRLKLAIFTSLSLDIAIISLLGLDIHLQVYPPHIPENAIPLQTLLHLGFPALRVLLLVPLLASLLSPRTVYQPVQSPDDDIHIAQPTASSFLLPPEAGQQQSSSLSINGDGSKYGTFRPRNNVQSVPQTRAATPVPSTNAGRESKPEISLEPTWGEVWERIRRLTPYLWPSNSRYLQSIAVICIFILLVGRVVNLALPLTLGELVKILEGSSGRSPWPYLFGYVGLRFLQGSGGLAAIRDALWAPVMQFSDLAMSQLAFDHILNLSFAWHTRRKTGEILRVLDRGAAINHTLELILFNIVPTFIDIFIALVAFCYLFDWSLALVIFVVMFTYVAASVILTQYRTRLRRQMNDRDVITRGIHTDCLLNYETVKYFGGEEHEGARFRDAMREYQTLEIRVILSLNLLNLVQNFIITVGLLVGSLMVARGVTRGETTASSFVIFITYLAQLYGPLNQLGYIYRSVNQSLVDTERLLALLNEPTEVNDKDNAPDLIVTEGEIEFQDVNFSYDGRTTALNRVSFKVPKGSAVALVGESGSGKSTILRLLYRFYDLQEGEGRILIDGQDIRDVTQKSLRQAIGVVPQDPVLFNSSIAYNIGYGKFDASREEVEEAARSAQMHERILTFPEGYDTKVGERGVRLSGGEKQRVAIARTLLKNPPILLLDEATSALDTSTEKDIQKALQNLVKGRSSLSIAHRLSTIATADLILVLKDGQIIEQGSHKELLALDGVFATMWADQISSTDAVSIAGDSLKKEKSQDSLKPSGSLKGYDAEVTNPVDNVLEGSSQYTEGLGSATQAGVDDMEVNGTTTASLEQAPGAEEAKDGQQTSEESKEAAVLPNPVSENQPIAFPSSDPVDEEDTPNVRSSPKDIPKALDGQNEAEPNVAVPAPIAFPTESTGTEIVTPPLVASPPAVTFGASAFSPPSSTGTPDPEAEPKRKRISSQNFQRLARRISLSSRRQGSVSSILPDLLRRDSSPRVSTDEGRGEGSSNPLLSDSPAASLRGDDKDKSKIKKKSKKRKDAN
ncbi:hypothetical protein D9611_000133 [Ephemerocybe angulata]|uniref:Mitochondrial half-size ABC transporter n=1 Tax=Ephemerocybe angulata TaxID=980116 RepID=A0A8H5F6Z9_9AGAR|nr:hypothetical protein D9611_000133 [Tulosesus angulatus]